MYVLGRGRLTLGPDVTQAAVAVFRPVRLSIWVIPAY